MKLGRWILKFVLMVMLVACGSVPASPIAPTPEQTDEFIAPLGVWSVVFVGKCQGRESKNIEVKPLTAEDIPQEWYV